MSECGEEREKREELLIRSNKYKYKYNNVNSTSKPTFLKSFYMPFEEADLLTAFTDVARREAGKRGFSTTIVQAMREYVSRHGKGNNQLLIVNYNDPHSPSPCTHLCNFSKGARNDGHIFCSNPGIVKSHDAVVLHGIQGNWLNGVTCYSCQFNKLRKKG
jgi:hypothetical protein